MKKQDQKTEKKRPLAAFIKGVAAVGASIFGHPLVRGTLKSLPVGNWAYEVAENIRHARNPEKAGVPLPHSAISLLAQAVFLALIVYAFVTHRITIDQVMEYVGIDDFKNFGTFPTDSIQ